MPAEWKSRSFSTRYSAYEPPKWLLGFEDPEISLIRKAIQVVRDSTPSLQDRIIADAILTELLEAGERILEQERVAYEMARTVDPE